MYHETPIVTWDNKGVTLLLGSCKKHDSKTTRHRMNEVAFQYNLPYYVYREKGESFVDVRSGHKCSKKRERLSFKDYKVSFDFPGIVKDCPDCALTLLANV